MKAPSWESVRARYGKHLLSLLLILLALSATSGVAALAFPRISVYDEATHIDYAYRTAHGGIPRKGERLSQEALSIWTCRGFYDDKADFADCAPPGDFKASSFPGGGYNYNQFHPPLYYTITGVSARALVAVTPIDSFVSAARLVGIAWIGGGLFLVYLLMLELGVSLFTARTMATSAAFVPAIWQSGSIVSNDASTIIAGASVALAAILISRDKFGPVLALVVAVFAMGTKSINGLALVFAALFLGYDVLSRYRSKRPYKSQALSAALMTLTLPLVNNGWRAIQSARTFDPNYVNPIKGASGSASEGIPFAELYSEIFRLLKPTFQIHSYLRLDTTYLELWRTLFEGLLAVGPLAAAMLLVAEPVRRRLGVSAVSAAAIGALIVVTQYWMSNDAFLIEANPRYGLALIPLNIVCASFLFDATQRSRLVGVAFGIVGALVTVPLLIGAL